MVNSFRGLPLGLPDWPGLKGIKFALLLSLLVRCFTVRFFATVHFSHALSNVQAVGGGAIGVAWHVALKVLWCP